MTERRCGTCRHWGKFHDALTQAPVVSGTPGVFYGCHDPKQPQTSVGRAEDMGTSCSRWAEQPMEKPLIVGRRLQLSDGEDDALIARRRKLLEGGYPALLEVVRELHEQLDVQARATREADQRHAVAVEETTRRAEAMAVRMFDAKEAEYQRVLRIAERTEEENYEAVTEEAAEMRLDDFKNMITQFVAEIVRVRRFGSTVASISIASSFCKAIERWLDSAEYNMGLIRKATDDPRLVAQVGWLCRVACYLPRDIDHLRAFYEHHHDKLLDREIMRQIYGNDFDRDPLFDDLPDVAVQRVATVLEER